MSLLYSLSSEQSKIFIENLKQELYLLKGYDGNQFIKTLKFTKKLKI